MLETTYDQDLFGSPEEAVEAEALFAAGKKEAGASNPVGTFQANINSAELKKSQSSDKLQITYELEILVGPSKGKKLYKYDGLGSEKQIPMTLGQLKRLGIDFKTLDLAKLKATLLGLKDTKVMINTKENGDFFNIYFQKKLAAVTPGTTEAKTGDKPKF